MRIDSSQIVNPIPVIRQERRLSTKRSLSTIGAPMMPRPGKS